MSAFENFVEKTREVDTPDALFGVLQEALEHQGYDKVLFAILSHHRDIGLEPGIGVKRNYPADWMDHYFDRRLNRIDPIPRYAMQCAEAFTWEEVEQKFELTPVQKECLAQGREAGLHHGVGVPLRGRRGEMAGISVATSEKRKSCALNTDLLTAYCNHFYLAYRRLHKPVEPPPRNIHLTPREYDVLSWAALGKPDHEIATLLTMSPHTVNRHLRSVFEKLGVNTRILAVVQALNLGLISGRPYLIE